jgi:hypothetical protein
MPRTIVPSGTHGVDRGVEVGVGEPVAGRVEAGRRHVHQLQAAGGVAAAELLHLQRADRAGRVVEHLERVVGGHGSPFDDFGRERNRFDSGAEQARCGHVVGAGPRAGFPEQLLDPAPSLSTWVKVSVSSFSISSLQTVSVSSRSSVCSSRTFTAAGSWRMPVAQQLLQDADRRMDLPPLALLDDSAH